MPAPWDYEALGKQAHPSIANAEFSVRTLRCVLSWRPEITLEELGNMPDEVLLKLPGLGRKSVREIREAYDSFMFPQLFDKVVEEPKPEEYTRRQTEALEKIVATLVLLVEEAQQHRRHKNVTLREDGTRHAFDAGVATLLAPGAAKVYVVMGNDFPDSVWATEELANAAVKQNKEADKLTRGQGYGPRVYYRVHPFRVGS